MSRKKKRHLTIRDEVDEWVALSPSYELNVFTTDKGELYFNLFPVTKGSVNTNKLLAEGYLVEEAVTGPEK